MIVLFIAYLIVGLVALWAIYNNKKLIALENRFCAAVKYHRDLKKEQKRVRTVEVYLDENGLTVIPKRGAKR